MAHPIVGHQDAGEVGVAIEDDAKEVVSLALVPVGRRKQVLDRIDLRRVAVDEGANAQLRARLEVAKLVHDLEAFGIFARRVGEMVDAGEEREEPEALGPQAPECLSDGLGRHGDPVVPCADAAFDYQRVRNHWRGLIPWALMRSCRIIRALSRSSGRGAQPGM